MTNTNEREGRAAQAAATRQIKAQFAPKYAALKAELRARIAPTGAPVERLAEMIEANRLVDALQRRVVAFATNERKASALEIDGWFRAEFRAISGAEARAISEARYEIEQSAWID